MRNREKRPPGESKWEFGQVLAVSLLLWPAFGFPRTFLPALLEYIAADKISDTYYATMRDILEHDESPPTRSHPADSQPTYMNRLSTDRWLPFMKFIVFTFSVGIAVDLLFAIGRQTKGKAVLSSLPGLSLLAKKYEVWISLDFVLLASTTFLFLGGHVGVFRCV